VLVALLVVLLARPAFAATGPDPRISEQWGLADIKAPQAWERGRGGGVSVAVVSTGVSEHEDLDSKVDAGFDATNGDAPRSDESGRGTHLAGIVGAATDNGTGIAGVAPEARLLPYKAFKTTSADDTFLEALNEARSAKVVLVDVPADYSGSKDSLRQALRTLGQRASVVVGAQGGLALDDLPVLAVAATTRSGGQAGGGAVGPRGVAAPGEGILSTTTSALLPNGDRYEVRSGTGQAAAHVAGAVAILRGLGASPTQAADLLRSTARKSGNADLGAGIIDVAAAAAAYQAPPPPPTTTTTKKAPVAAAPTTKVTAPAGPPASVPGSTGPVFDDEDSELGEGQEEAVAPPGLEEFNESGEQRGPSILIGGRERPWVPLTVGFGLLFGVGTAMSLTFRRLGAEPT